MAICGCFLGTNANAFLIGDEFGVAPAVNMTDGQTDTLSGGTSYHFEYGSLLPTKNLSTVDYIIDDWYGSWSKSGISETSNLNYNGYGGVVEGGTGVGHLPSGGEPYDVEGLYFNDDATNMYLVIVTSIAPPPGIIENRAGGLLVPTGDLSINMKMNGAYSDGFHYDFGLNINHETRPASGDVTVGGTEVGQDFYKTTNAAWYVGTPDHAVDGTGELTNFDPTGPNAPANSTTFLGNVTSDYRLINMTAQENQAPTYAIEVTIPKSFFSGYTIQGQQGIQAGDTLEFQFMPGCRNDVTGKVAVVSLNATIDVPEPASVGLLSTGLALLALRRRPRSQANQRK